MAVAVTLGAVVLIAGLVVLGVLLATRLLSSGRDGDGGVVASGTPSTSSEPASPSPTPSPAQTAGTSAGPGSYWREVIDPTPEELAAYGQLTKGACVMHMPRGDLAGTVVPTVPCSDLHTTQVAGFVDAISEMPDDPIAYETAVAQRCNTLKVAVGVPQGSVLYQTIHAGYPDQEERAAGITVAICYITLSTPWTGSVLDGTVDDALVVDR